MLSGSQICTQGLGSRVGVGEQMSANITGALMDRWMGASGIGSAWVSGLGFY